MIPSIIDKGKMKINKIGGGSNMQLAGLKNHYPEVFNKNGPRMSRIQSNYQSDFQA